MREVEEKRDALILEEKSKGTPQEERENLVQQVILIEIHNHF